MNKRVRNMLPALAAAILVGFGNQSSESAAAQSVSASQALPAAPVVMQSIQNDISPPIHLLAVAPVTAGATQIDVPLFPLPKGAAAGSESTGARGGAAALPTLPMPAPAINLPEPVVSFDGIKQADNQAILGRTVTPPDPNGAVSPTHYVQFVNLLFAVYDTTGTLLYGPVPGNTPWQGFGGPCERQNNGDPIVLYDKLAGRWMLSQFALPNYPYGPFYQCVAVSQTYDPTGAFYRYAFLISDTKFNDYGKFGVWPDGYYMAVNQFNAGSLTWGGGGVVAFERNKMLRGEPARSVYFDLGPVDDRLGGMLPADLDGLTLPPPGAPNYFLEFDIPPDFPTHRLNLFEFRVNWDNPMTSTFVGPVALETGPFNSRLCTAPRGACIPQPQTPQRLEGITDRLMYRLQYRNFDGFETLVTNHTVNVGTLDAPHAGIRWYELRRARVSPWRIFQQGTYAPDAEHRWMGSAAMDRDGNIGLGYTVSSETTFPSIRYVGRTRSDPPGTMPQGETTLMAGGGSQTDLARWGDYSMLAVDPTDDCTFWFTHEYYAQTSPRGWQTRIGSFGFPSCGYGLAATRAR